MDTDVKCALTDSLVIEDQKYVWHPFTQAKTALPPIPIVRGEGAYLYSSCGKRYIDAISSWWVNLHGHAHPYIADKIAQQARSLEHAIFAEFTHQPAIDLAKGLIEILPGGMSKIFYTDNGSTAVEVALKMAIQYWHNHQHHSARSKIISFKNAYHGDTFGAMAAASKNDYNRPFWPYLFDVESIDPPFFGKEDVSYAQLQNCIKNAACFIYEPVIQGSGGMISHSTHGLDALIKLAKSHNVITIADEVMTGFGRTGPLFASSHMTNQPDIICLSKGLTGGFLPLGATACRQEIFDMFLGDDKSKALLHGHSYTANPLACTAGLASLDLLLTQTCSQQRRSIESLHNEFKNNIGSHPKLTRCDVTGTILALEYRSQEGYSYFNKLRDQLSSFFLSKQILLRPLGNVLYILPPYCICPEDLKEIYDAIFQTIEGKL